MPKKCTMQMRFKRERGVESLTLFSVGSIKEVYSRNLDRDEN